MIIPARQSLAVLLPIARQQVYLVGGSVRDLLAGVHDIKDIDVLIPSGSAAVARSFADAVKGSFFFLDEERKITRVVQRLDNGSLQFDFTDYIGNDLLADLGRRDFAMNAMALDLREYLGSGSLDKIIDPFHGREDVKNRIIRVVRPGVLDEDPLRLLRAVRFAATLGFSIEEQTQAHIRSRAALATRPAPERIRDELFQVFSQRGADGHLALMDSLGLLPRLLPELDALSGFAPGRYHLYDVRTHSIKTAGYVDSVLDDLPKLAPAYAHLVLAHLDEMIEFSVPRIAALRFACLMHDVAKPETFSQDAAGHIHFFGHDNLGGEKVKETCRRLRLSRDAEALVAKVIKQHMRLFHLASAGGPSRNALYRYCRDLGDALPESLVLAQADARATYDLMPKEKFTDTEKPMAAVLEYYYEKFLKTELKPLVTGRDLIEQGLAPGPRFREILDELKERQAAGLFNNRSEALDYLKKMS